MIKQTILQDSVFSFLYTLVFLLLILLMLLFLYRVLSTLQQLPEFSEAFSCSRDRSMNSQEHCRMW